MSVFRLTPWVLALVRLWSPDPSTNRKRSGWISEAAILIRSLANRIRSRRHTIRIARNSE